MRILYPKIEIIYDTFHPPPLIRRLEIFNFRNNPKEGSFEERRKEFSSKIFWFWTMIDSPDASTSTRIEIPSEEGATRKRQVREGRGKWWTRQVERWSRVSFFPLPFEFSNRCNRDIDELTRRENRSFRATCERDCFFCHRGKDIASSFFFLFFSRAFSFSIDFCSLPAPFK